MSIPVQLWLLLDSRSPAGAHHHSGGMESAVTSGDVDTVDDVELFCLGRLATAGRVAAAFAATACLAWQAGWTAPDWARLDAELSARTASAATRTASRAMGSGLYRLLRASAPDQVGALGVSWRSCPPPAPHHALVLGAACAVAGGSAQVAARAAALASCTGPASAAVRLLGLDPLAVQGVLAALAPRIEAVADEAVHLRSADPADLATLPADAAPALDQLADVHAQLGVRLFAS